MNNLYEIKKCAVCGSTPIFRSWIFGLLQGLNCPNCPGNSSPISISGERIMFAWNQTQDRLEFLYELYDKRNK